MRSEHTKWVMLALAAFTIMGSYYTYDSIAPVAGLLRDERGLSQSQIGLLNAVFNLPNIALALIGGIIIDRIGAAKAILIAAVICTIGAVLTAVGEPFGLMLFGRLLFGLGNETLYIALLVGIAQWFHLGGGALAIALFFSMARVGSYSADKSTSWFADVYAAGWQAPLWLAAGLTATGVFSALIYYLVDSRFPHLRAVGQKSERFMLKDLTGFSRSFWYILWLNVLFASVFFPFRSTFSIQYFMDVKGMNLAEAGTANSYVFAAAIFATPIFGLLADRIGRRASLLTFAAALMPLTFVILATTNYGLWVTTVLMGLSFSVIPAVIWPATAMLVEKHRVGTAFGLINMIQSLGLAAANYGAGYLNDVFKAGPNNPQGYDAMLSMFALLSLIAFFATLLLLLRERRQHNGGIEARLIGQSDASMQRH
ncbi:MAG: MFS transporter [Sphingorhabdus sp.]|uniref:MFS transporter n=1 Tax=Sphingorhabdus sp. TaxID=1902408 RepID=UPI0038FD00B1